MPGPWGGGFGGSSPRWILRAAAKLAKAASRLGRLGRSYSVGREVPNMISSQDGTEERRDLPPAALRAGRSRWAAAAGGLSC